MGEGYHYPIFLPTPDSGADTRNILEPSSEYMQYYFLNHEILQERLWDNLRSDSRYESSTDEYQTPRRPWAKIALISGEYQPRSTIIGGYKTAFIAFSVVHPRRITVRSFYSTLVMKPYWQFNMPYWFSVVLHDCRLRSTAQTLSANLSASNRQHVYAITCNSIWNQRQPVHLLSVCMPDI
jgi:hypothetical protein